MAHAGFETAQESVLETLTDLVHEHYLRLTRLLRVAVDREARLGASPFPDVMEQVFHEVGIGSVLALQHFWQVRIKDYHSYMLQVREDKFYDSPQAQVTLLSEGACALCCKNVEWIICRLGYAFYLN